MTNSPSVMHADRFTAVDPCVFACIFRTDLSLFEHGRGGKKSIRRSGRVARRVAG